MMMTFNWRRIGLIYDAPGFYHQTTFNDFARSAASLSNIELILQVPIVISGQSSYLERFIADGITDTFNIINNQEVRISYWSITEDESSFLFCEVFKRNYLWPGHVYILQESSVNTILKTETSCTHEQMIQAMEGVFLLQYRIYVENNVELYSGWTYEEFQQRYAAKLREEAVNRIDNVNENIYANSLYDQVWAFALALNSSLLDIEAQNLSFDNYAIGNTKVISGIIKEKLSKVDFQGATGRIMFDRNQSIPSFVDIKQIKNGKEILIGVYDPFQKNITHQNFPDSIPKDTFQTVYILLPLWLGSCIVVIQFTLLCLITTNTVLLLQWREIKASGPILSIPIMISCYLLCAAPILLTVKEMVLIRLYLHFCDSNVI